MHLLGYLFTCLFWLFDHAPAFPRPPTATPMSSPETQGVAWVPLTGGWGGGGGVIRIPLFEVIECFPHHLPDQGTAI